MVRGGVRIKVAAASGGSSVVASSGSCQQLAEDGPRTIGPNTSLLKSYCEIRMVAQPGTNPRVVAPSANQMATKREASSLPGEAEDVGARASSVKSTPISEA